MVLTSVRLSVSKIHTHLECRATSHMKCQFPRCTTETELLHLRSCEPHSAVAKITWGRLAYIPIPVPHLRCTKFEPLRKTMEVWSPQACLRDFTLTLENHCSVSKPVSCAVSEPCTFSAGNRNFLVHRRSRNRLPWGEERNTSQSGK